MQEREYRAAQPGRMPWWWLFVAVIFLIMLLPMYMGVRSVWGLSTLRYELTPTELRIPFGPDLTAIPRDQIQRTEVLSPTGGRRLGGTGMGGLQEGRWRFDQTGPIRMFSTTTRPLLVLQTPTGKWGISPADPAGFQQALASGQTGVFEPPHLASPWETGLLGVVSVGMPVGVWFMLFYLGRVGRSITYTLGEDQLLIRVGWSRILVPYAAIRSVAEAEPSGTPLKLVAAAMPGLYWGSFRWKAAGSGLRLYSTRYKPLVLICTADHTYGVTPEEPVGFVTELKQRVG